MLGTTVFKIIPHLFRFQLPENDNLQFDPPTCFGRWTMQHEWVPFNVGRHETGRVNTSVDFLLKDSQSFRFERTHLQKRLKYLSFRCCFEMKTDSLRKKLEIRKNRLPELLCGIVWKSTTIRSHVFTEFQHKFFV